MNKKHLLFFCLALIFNTSIFAQDDTEISLTCPEDIILHLFSPSNTLLAYWEDPIPITTCPSGITVFEQITGPRKNNPISVGFYTVTYQAQDGCGNIQSCIFNISVIPDNNGCDFFTILSDDSFRIVGLTGNENTKVFDADFNVVFECAPWNENPCASNELINNLAAGDYFASIQSAVCDEFIPFSISGGCVDNDNDGLCADEDCDDNDANLPATVGSICDDGNPTTSNDVIQQDACTCIGNPNCFTDVEVLTVSCTATTITFTVIVSIGPSVIGWGIEDINGNDIGSGLRPYGVPVEVTADINNLNSPYTFFVFDSDARSTSCPGEFQVECPAQGCNISTFADNGSITIGGLTGAENTKVFDADFNVVFECAPWNGNPCTGTEIASGLSTGTYFVSVQSDNCDLFLTVNVNGSGCIDNDNDGVCADIDCNDNEPFLPTTPGTSCNDNNSATENDVYLSDGCSCEGTPVTGCTVSVDAFYNGVFGGVEIQGMSLSYNVKLFDENIEVVWQCNPWGDPRGCPLSYVFLVAQPGDSFFLSVQSDNCNEWIPITVSGISGDDPDGDGVPNDQDCEPNDPNLPAIAGTSCDDNNPNTENDIYQSDGCECKGTPIDGICNVSFSETELGQITITGLTSAENTKLFDSNANSSGIVWECNPWSTPCSDTEVVNGLNPGAQYFLAVQSDNCSEWIPFELNISSAGNNSQFNKTNALEKFSIVKVFPNPATDEAFVLIESTFNSEMTLEIYNATGQRQATNLYSIENGKNTIELNINKLNAGIYHLFVRNKIGQTQSLRFVKIRD